MRPVGHDSLARPHRRRVVSWNDGHSSSLLSGFADLLRRIGAARWDVLVPELPLEAANKAETELLRGPNRL